jgi:predicted Zn-dependent protease with MMP-like domain
MPRTLRLAAVVLPWLAACSSSPEEVTALDVVTETPYRSLLLEVDAQAGVAPTTAALDDVVAELESLVVAGALGKPDGIAARVDETLPASAEPDRAWSVSELVALGDDHRSAPAASGQLALQVLAVDGHFEEDTETERVLGIAIGHDRIALFGASIADACAAVAPRLQGVVCGLAEASVLLHEIGHATGLVAGGLPMAAPHQDSEHGAHDVDEDCIMHWLADRSSFVTLLADRARAGEAAPSPFCDACLADLTAAQTPPSP